MESELEPPEIELEELVFDIEFHPTQPVVALGMITGHVKL